MTRLRADLLLLLASIIWGLSFLFQKGAMAVMGPHAFIMARSLVAVLALLPFAWLEARRATAPIALPALWPMAVLAGACFFAGLALQQTGLLTASITNAGFLTTLYVVMTPLVAWAWHRSAPRAVVWWAVLLSFAGAWLLGGGAVAKLVRGDLLVAGSAVFWALQMVVTAAMARHERPILLMLLQFTVMALLGLAAIGVSGEAVDAGMLRAAGWAIAYTGVLSSALTFTVLAWAMKYTPSSEAAVLTSTESLFSALAGALLLGERLPLSGWLGAALMLGAVLLVQLAPARQPAAPVAAAGISRSS
jgi:drug/metabolite transporter (DMT)-like permease